MEYNKLAWISPSFNTAFYMCATVAVEKFHVSIITLTRRQQFFSASREIKFRDSYRRFTFYNACDSIDSYSHFMAITTVPRTLHSSSTLSACHISLKIHQKTANVSLLSSSRKYTQRAVYFRWWRRGVCFACLHTHSFYCCLIMYTNAWRETHKYLIIPLFFSNGGESLYCRLLHIDQTHYK